ncbi:MAG: branched-chain amino acid ABC transporter permease [Candidatus Liptonbacteria bacterium]|nr:branched-chain amino acid ABC transporter permease [Candidatus Liptonbacteria bacterium]
MSYLIHLSTLFSIYAILGVSLNLLIGYTGLISVMHAAFFGVGAYATALLMTKLGLNFFLAAILGAVISGVIGCAIGWLFARLGGDYYVMGSVAWNFIVVSILINWESLTNGPLGIPGIPKPSLGGFSFGSNVPFLILSLIFLVCVYAISRWVVRSSFGRVIKAVREDEEAARVFGYHTLFFKVAVSGIATAMAGIAGALFASYITFIEPTTFSVMESVLILAIVIFGGFANIRGSLLGAFALVLIPEALRFAGFSADIAANMQQLVYGLVLVLFMLYRPQGLIGEYRF